MINCITIHFSEILWISFWLKNNNYNPELTESSRFDVRMFTDLTVFNSSYTIFLLYCIEIAHKPIVIYSTTCMVEMPSSIVI